LVKNAILACGFHQGVLSANQHPILRDLIIRTMFRSLFPVMQFEDAIFFIFISGFSLTRLHGTSKDDNLESVINHFAEKFDAKCDFHAIDMRAGDPLDQLKFSNIANIFGVLVRIVTDPFDFSAFDSLPIFQTEQFISSRAQLPS
jgi:hypothetical protein